MSKDVFWSLSLLPLLLSSGSTRLKYLFLLSNRRCKLIVHLLNLYRRWAKAVVMYYCQLMMRSVIHGWMHACIQHIYYLFYSTTTTTSSSSSFGLFLSIWNESKRRMWDVSIRTKQIYHLATFILFIWFSFLSSDQTISGMTFLFFFFFFFFSSQPHFLHQVTLECSDWTLFPLFFFFCLFHDDFDWWSGSEKLSSGDSFVSCSSRASIWIDWSQSWKNASIPRKESMIVIMTDGDRRFVVPEAFDVHPQADHR